MFDVLIIGGGIVGCSVGRFLSKYDIKLGLLEKNTEVCQETTKANTAIAHGGFDCVPGTLKARLNVRGNSMMEQLSRELGFTFNKIGSLVLAFNDKETGILGELMTRGEKSGVKDLEIIDPDRIHEIEPKVSGKVQKALYCPQAGVIDPFNFTYGMIENAVTNGLKLFTETEVTGIEAGEDRIIVRADRNEFETKFLINAAGLYSDRIAAMAGDFDFKIIPTKGVYRLMDKTEADYIHTVLFQTPTELGKGVVVTPTYDGNTMIGPTSEKIGSRADTTTDLESLEIIDELSRISVPDIDFGKTIRVFTGVRAKPDTGDFMIYPSKNIPGLIHAGGIESPGLVSSPAIAEYVESILLGIGFDHDLKDSFDPIRKPFTRIVKLTDEEKNALIAKDPLYGRIICRCETVSEAEIVEAIRRPGGARTVDGVKRRVRAGMGRCQGGFCGPRVLEILSRELGKDPAEIKKELSGSEIVEGHLKENDSEGSGEAK